MQAIHLRSTYNIRQNLGHLKTKSLALKLGACKRKDRKFSVVDMLLSYWQLIPLRQFSYDNWASQISSLTGKIVSGQAVCKRMNFSIIIFLQELLKKSFKQKCETLFDSALFKFFPNVYIQDATHFSLPRILAYAFPGSYSKYGESATAKIQATFNLKRGLFSGFQLFSFRDNDQKNSPKIITQLNSGDLVIRDLGYFVLKVFMLIQEKGAFFLSRYKFGISLYDNKTGAKIDLLKTLRKKGYIDNEVKMGSKEKISCRLVAIALPEKVVAERRRKAKADRNKKANHSDQYFELLGYSIYITNVPKQVWSAEQIVKAYRIRWYIEILFKGWKSNLKMRINIPERYLTKQRAEFFFYASLLMVNLLVMPLFTHAIKVGRNRKKHLSILKICEFITQQLHAIVRTKRMDKLIDQAVYYGAYEKRISRTNIAEYNIFDTC